MSREIVDSSVASELLMLAAQSSVARTGEVEVAEPKTT